MPKTAALWVGLGLTVVGSPGLGAEPQLTFDSLFAEDVDGRRPGSLAWRPGKAELSYLWDEDGQAGLWLVGAASGEPRLVFPRERLGVEELDDAAYQWTPDGSRLLLQLEDDLWLLEPGRERRRLTESEGEEEEPVFSPDGSRLAYVRGDELYVLDLASGRERRLTHDGDPGIIFNGTTDWVYWEEIWGRDATGFWWSPDGSRIAYYHFDDTEVGVYPLVDTDSVYPELDRQRYPKAGGTLPAVEVRVVGVDSREHRSLQTGGDRDSYLARVHWHPDGHRVAVERLSREQDRLDLLLCEISDGACRVVLTESWPTWINLGDEFRFLDDGRFIWGSERSGWRRLYLYGADGELIRPLTPPDIAVTSLDGWNPEEGWLVFTGYRTEGLGGAERHVFLALLAGGQPRSLDQDGGWNSALVSEQGYWVHTRSDSATPPRQSVRVLVGASPPRPLPSRRSTHLDPETLPRWERFTIPGPDGSRLPAQLLKPRDFDPARRYPVVMYHYGCPASQVVSDRWGARGRNLWHLFMAERGYLVLSVDNQASLFFGKAGEDKLHRRFGDLELAAQLAGVDYLKGLPYFDPERIGLWGWSGGGSNTLYSLFKSPGVWKAGMAGAPVTDWRYYDAIWIERYLDHPEANAEGYEASSPLTFAAELEDHLLLAHGTGDNNVHPQNTINLIKALLDAGRPYEVTLYPNARHSLRPFKSYDRDFYRRMTGFFDRYLGGGG